MRKSEMGVYIELRVHVHPQRQQQTSNISVALHPRTIPDVAERNTTTRKNSKRSRFHRKTKAIACGEDVPGITLPIQLVSAKAVTSIVKVSATWLVAAERHAGRMPELSIRLSHTTRDATFKFNAFRELHLRTVTDQANYFTSRRKYK